MSALITTPTSQLLDNSGNSISLRSSHFSLIWTMGNLLIGYSIPETVHEFALGCWFDEIKRLTKFDT